MRKRRMPTLAHQVASHLRDIQLRRCAEHFVERTVEAMPELEASPCFGMHAQQAIELFLLDGGQLPVERPLDELLRPLLIHRGLRTPWRAASSSARARAGD